MRRFTAVLALAGIALSPSPARAAPDPLFASLLSAGSTALPVGISGGMLFFGKKEQEGLRFDLGLTFLAIGASIGPSVGQIYGEGGVDAVVTFLLRTATTAVMVTGAGLSLRGDSGAQSAGTPLFVIGAVPTVFLAFWDFFGAASSAKAARYKEGHVSAGELDVSSLLRCPGPIPCL